MITHAGRDSPAGEAIDYRPANLLHIGTGRSGHSRGGGKNCQDIFRELSNQHDGPLPVSSSLACKSFRLVPSPRPGRGPTVYGYNLHLCVFIFPIVWLYKPKNKRGAKILPLCPYLRGIPHATKWSSSSRRRMHCGWCFKYHGPPIRSLQKRGRERDSDGNMTGFP